MRPSRTRETTAASASPHREKRRNALSQSPEKKICKKPNINSTPQVTRTETVSANQTNTMITRNVTVNEKVIILSKATITTKTTPNMLTTHTQTMHVVVDKKIPAKQKTTLQPSSHHQQSLCYNPEITESGQTFKILSLHHGLQDAVENEKTGPYRVTPEIQCYIEGLPTAALVDTGSDVSCVSEEMWQAIITAKRRPPTLPVTAIQLRGAVGQKSCRIILQSDLEVSLEGRKHRVAGLIVKDLIKPVILGADWLTEVGAIIDFRKKMIKIRATEAAAELEIYFRNTFDIHEDSPAATETAQNCTIAAEKRVTKKPRRELSAQIQDKIEQTRCDPKHKHDLMTVLMKHSKVFQEDPGLTTLYEHQIELYDNTPFIKRPYPVAFALRPAVEETIQEMLRMNIITREASAFANPMTVTKKKDGSVRICLDARTLNERMVADTETPPAPEELLRYFRDVKVMSTIDLRSSFWQIPLHKDSRKYTAFLYNGRSYVYTRLPFGLKTSTGSFSRAMDVVLGPELRQFAVNYIDDLLVASSNWQDHQTHLDRVLEKLEAANMTVNLEKSAFLQTEVKFLGHVLTTNGIQADPAKVVAIRKFPTPQKQKHLRAFLGLCNYYRKFAQRYSEATQQLTHLLRKDTKWQWGPSEQKAFDDVKNLFLDTILLKHPDAGRTFYVQTDSSGYGLGATLYQLQEEGEKGVIAFASRSLRGAELNYTTTEKELLGVIFALDKFRMYIQGAKIVIRTDHQALTFLGRCRLLNERLTRWTLFLGQFDYSIEHVKGKHNIVPDVLSRFPIDGDGTNAYPREQPTIALFEVEDSPEIIDLLQDLKRLQQDDELLGAIRKHKHSPNEPCEDPAILRVSKYYQLEHSDVLCYRCEHDDGARIAIPASCIKRLTWYHHQLLGHFGASKVHQVMKKVYHWPDMSRSIRKIIRSCDLCQKTKHQNRRSQGPMTPIIAERLGQLVCVDFFGPLPNSRGCSYIFVVVDAFSKFLKLYPIKSANTKTAANKLLLDYITYIKPSSVLSDHGTQFTSKKWQERLKAADILPTHSSIRHPASNPCERVMRELGRIFRAYCQNQHTNWATHLPQIEECLNQVPHESTGYSPYQILYGREPPMPMDALTNKWLPTRKAGTVEKIHENVLKNLRHHAELRCKQQKGITTKLQIGDWVLLKTNPLSEASTGTYAKFLPLYEGPYVVTATPHPNTYSIAHVETQARRGVFNMANLKLYHRPDDTEDSGN